MGKSIKGSQTEKNLLAAFAGESQARNRYTYFASAAKKEGFEQISHIFLETAENEKEHAKVFFKFLLFLFINWKKISDIKWISNYSMRRFQSLLYHFFQQRLARRGNGTRSLFPLFSGLTGSPPT